MDERSMNWVLTLIFFSLISSVSPSYGYDSSDPNGNITIKWDIMQWYSATYLAKVSISNFQLFRHVEHPGWKLSWRWQGDEVIWNMWGAEATEQGNCSAFKGNPELPHSCEKQPVIIDLLPGAPYNLQFANCCKRGILSSMTQDPSKYGAAFQMSVGASSSFNFSSTIMSSEDLDNSTNILPTRFSLGLPGYTCGEPFEVPPSKFSADKGRRWTQALMTWKVTCSFSQFLASPDPTCCVSLSAFYNDTIVECPRCSCGCQGLPGAKCVKPGKEPALLQMPQSEEEGEGEPQPLVRCSQHMCPIRVHWHVKVSYREYWRVKMTVTNLNLVKNYSQWNLVVVHPNLQSTTQVFSFNYQPLNQFGNIRMFWGIQYYNDMLLQSGESGNIQTEMLLHKDPGIFTFREGWAFPRKIFFNGQQCVMPPPDEYPRLPNTGLHSTAPPTSHVIFFSLFFFTVILFSDSISS